MVDLRIGIVNILPRKATANATVERHDATIDETIENTIEWYLSTTHSNHIVTQFSEKRSQSFPVIEITAKIKEPNNIFENIDNNY